MIDPVTYTMSSESERQYRDWCTDQWLDPEDVGSMVAYEQYVTYALEEEARA